MEFLDVQGSAGLRHNLGYLFQITFPWRKPPSHSMFLIVALPRVPVRIWETLSSCLGRTPQSIIINYIDAYN